MTEITTQFINHELVPLDRNEAFSLLLDHSHSILSGISCLLLTRAPSDLDNADVLQSVWFLIAVRIGWHSPLFLLLLLLLLLLLFTLAFTLAFYSCLCFCFLKEFFFCRQRDTVLV